MSAVYIHNATSWEEADAAFEAFAVVVPDRRRELAERVAATGGPDLDRSVESLDAVNRWFIAQVLDRPAPPDVDYRPAWMPPTNPDYRWRPGLAYPAPGWLLLLWEQVGVYVGDVMTTQVPGARWVCWRDRQKRHISNGKPVVDVGVPTGASDTLACANAGVLRAWSERDLPGGVDVPDPGRQRAFVEAVLARRAAYLEEHPARWQAAPTGPRASRPQATPPP
ncbi:hypothetical protein AB6N23_10850 [Cellulomonas sp. 179-A 9B4 NHS]|uniref:hypothetical protein n=1 Tax=Cellulomonas sp. 179-A 9B4 NHS TaxID=3142379 RepID=UPI0039A38013